MNHPDLVEDGCTAATVKQFPQQKQDRENGFSRPCKIVEVGPRDGLQNEAVSAPAAVKIELIERLAQAGIRGGSHRIRIAWVGAANGGSCRGHDGHTFFLFPYRILTP